MLGDISYDKATLQSMGKKSINPLTHCSFVSLLLFYKSISFRVIDRGVTGEDYYFVKGKKIKACVS